MQAKGIPNPNKNEPCLPFLFGLGMPMACHFRSIREIITDKGRSPVAQFNQTYAIQTKVDECEFVEEKQLNERDRLSPMCIKNDDDYMGDSIFQKHWLTTENQSDPGLKF